MNPNAIESNVASSSSRSSRGLNVALWLVQALIALAFLGASSAKLLGKPEMIALFETIGIGQWFRYVTGAIELAGAALVVTPKGRVLGAGLLACVMFGAIATRVFVLHDTPLVPLVFLSMLAFVIWGRRDEARGLLGR